jgi:predicted O-methyltransferase YrrM
MSLEQWTAVDEYLCNKLLPTDAILEAALDASEAAGLPSIAVSPPQGKLLHLLAKIRGAKRILEIGTLGGYSTIWLARALPPEGRLITLELDPKHAEVARSNLARAAVGALVEIRVGRALDSLAKLEQERAEAFDLVFIDADKPSNPEYFARALRLTRRGSIIVVDNVVRKGAIIHEASGDANVEGVRRLNDIIAGERRVTATAIQTVGSKGYDGFTLALVTDDPDLRAGH